MGLFLPQNTFTDAGSSQPVTYTAVSPGTVTIRVTVTDIGCMLEETAEVQVTQTNH